MDSSNFHNNPIRVAHLVNGKTRLREFRSLSKTTQFVSVGTDFNLRPSDFRLYTFVILSFSILHLSHLLARKRGGRREEQRRKGGGREEGERKEGEREEWKEGGEIIKEQR